jgi:hypothetical protein
MKIVVRTHKAEVEIDLPNGTSSFDKHIEGIVDVLNEIVEQINKIEE